LIKDFLRLLQKLFAYDLHKHRSKLNEGLHIHIAHILISSQCDFRLINIFEAARPHNSEARCLLHHWQDCEEYIREEVAKKLKVFKQQALTE
jgi:hypothetical protein